MEKTLDTVLLMLEGSTITLEIFCVTLALALPLGLFAALGRLSRFRLLSRLLEVYIWIMRGTPLMLQLLFVYFALPMVGIMLPDIAAALLAFVLNYAAYFAEIFRAGIQAVPRGQVESARAIGLRRAQILRHVVLPQALAIALPALTANALFLVKETSVINAVSVAELLFVTKDIIGTDYMTNEALFMLLVSYLVLLLPLSWLAAWVEKRMRRAEYGGA